MPKAIIVNYRECTGCRICELTCSVKNEGKVSYEHSRIRVYPYSPGLDVTIVCVQCQIAPCIEACPQKIIERFSTEKRAWIVKREQDHGAIGDCLISCRFVRGVVGEERYIRMLNAASGMEMTPDEFVRVGERIWNLTRMFNVCEGFTRKDDTLPKRIFIEPLPSGVAKGQILTQAQLNQMLGEYYELRRWDKNTGIPTKEKLRELKLDFVNV